MTLVSDFEASTAITSTLSSGGVEPDAALVFESSIGFDDLVVGNGGDGTLALFEEERERTESMFSTEVESDLPMPRLTLAFSALSGGEVEFYGVTAGRESATLVALTLQHEATTFEQPPPGDKTNPKSDPGTPLEPINNIAQLGAA